MSQREISLWIPFTELTSLNRVQVGHIQDKANTGSAGLATLLPSVGTTSTFCVHSEQTKPKCDADLLASGESAAATTALPATTLRRATTVARLLPAGHRALTRTRLYSKFSVLSSTLVSTVQHCPAQNTQQCMQYWLTNTWNKAMHTLCAREHHNSSHHTLGPVVLCLAHKAAPP